MASETPKPNNQRSIRAACVQMRSGLDRSTNTQIALDLIGRAADAGANFVATPEMTNVIDRKAGRLLKHLPSEEALEEITAFADAARQHGVWLLAGSFAMKAPSVDPSRSKAFNRSLLFRPDGHIEARYDKLHMFDVSLPQGETWRESAVYQAGEKTVMVPASINTHDVNLGLSICYDVRFAHLYRQLAQKAQTFFACLLHSRGKRAAPIGKSYCAQELSSAVRLLLRLLKEDVMKMVVRRMAIP